MLSLADPTVRVDACGVARWALEALLSRPSARARLATVAALPLGGPIDDAERALDAALTRPLANGVRARAALAVTIPTLALDDGLRLVFEASGDVELSVYAPE